MSKEELSRQAREEAERALKKESELARERARKAADMMKMDDEEEADMTKPGARGPDGKLLVPTFPEVHAVIAQNGERSPLARLRSRVCPARFSSLGVKAFLTQACVAGTSDPDTLTMKEPMDWGKGLEQVMKQKASEEKGENRPPSRILYGHLGLKQPTDEEPNKVI